MRMVEKVGMGVEEVKESIVGEIADDGGGVVF